MKRETKIITTPIGGHKIEIKSWITGMEKRMLRKPFLTNIKITEEGGLLRISEFNTAQATEEVENLAIELLIVSIDGKKENILDRVLNMHEKDYDFIMNEINKIYTEEDFKDIKKKQ